MLENSMSSSDRVVGGIGKAESSQGLTFVKIISEQDAECGETRQGKDLAG